ncbi:MULTISPECIES: MFS transporter [unclassified Acinetobacter]|uniref:MFS transporter n=1 Tax=unclassified Acinetobacter TaxID=196816 RepID=UPI0035B768C1
MNKLATHTSAKFLFMVALLYIAHALPLYFFNVAVPAILRQQGVDVRWIGMLSLLYLPWAFKFFWASWVDNHYHQKLGKRKTWLLLTQIIIVTGLFILAGLNWQQMTLLLALSFVISTASATQDIAIDGYTIEHVEKSQFSLASATQSLGIALGSMLGGAGVLWLYQTYNWHVAIISLAMAIMLISMVLLFLPSEKTTTARILSSLDKVQPYQASLKHLIQRPEVKWILLFIIVFRSVEAPAMAMLNPMLVDFGWSLAQIGGLFSVLGAIVGIVSAISAGFISKKIGAKACLTWAGWLRTAVYIILFLILTYPMLTANMPKILFNFDALNSALGLTILVLLAIRYLTMTALYALFMQYSSQQQAGTDFTLFVCVELLVYFVGGAFSGFLVHQLGYGKLFLVLSICSILSMLLMPMLMRQIITKSASV